MTDISPAQPIVQLLRQALAHLYDPVYLRHCGLVHRLDGVLPADAPPLREQLVSAIEALRPGEDQPLDSKSSRYYAILYARYVQGFTQRDVANDLGLSIRHLRREQAEAIALLAESLAEGWGLEDAPLPVADEPLSAWDGPKQGDAGQALDREVERLGGSMSGDVADFVAHAREALGLVSPLLAQHEATLVADALDGLGETPVSVPGTVLKQALLTLLITAAHFAEGETLTVLMDAEGETVELVLLGETPISPCAPPDPESLDVTQRLLQPFGGSVHAWSEEGRAMLKVLLPSARCYRVLAIEDNTDSLGLWERYLQDTPFLLVAVSDPTRALAATVAESPDVILLDVMMPGVDGWDLLAQLRNHPETSDVPVIICTVLPQRELALSLGASDFIRKPATRQAFTETLARVVRG